MMQSELTFFIAFCSLFLCVDYAAIAGESSIQHLRYLLVFLKAARGCGDLS